MVSELFHSTDKDVDSWEWELANMRLEDRAVKCVCWAVILS